MSRLALLQALATGWLTNLDAVAATGLGIAEAHITIGELYRQGLVMARFPGGGLVLYRISPAGRNVYLLARAGLGFRVESVDGVAGYVFERPPPGEPANGSARGWAAFADDCEDSPSVGPRRAGPVEAALDLPSVTRAQLDAAPGPMAAAYGVHADDGGLAAIVSAASS